MIPLLQGLDLSGTGGFPPAADPDVGQIQMGLSENNRDIVGISWVYIYISTYTYLYIDMGLSENVGLIFPMK